MTPDLVEDFELAEGSAIEKTGVVSEEREGLRRTPSRLRIVLCARYDQRTMHEVKRFFAVAGEHTFFALTLLMLTPVVLSEKGQELNYLQVMPVIIVASVGSRWCAWLVERESWTGLVLKTLMFTAAGFAMHLRVGLSN